MTNVNPVCIRPGHFVGINTPYADIEYALRNLPYRTAPFKPVCGNLKTAEDARAYAAKLEEYEAKVATYEAEAQATRDIAVQLQALWNAKLRREYDALPDDVYALLYTHAKENTHELYELREMMGELSTLAVAIHRAYKGD